MRLFAHSSMASERFFFLALETADTWHTRGRHSTAMLSHCTRKYDIKCGLVAPSHHSSPRITAIRQVGPLVSLDPPSATASSNTPPIRLRSFAASRRPLLAPRALSHHFRIPSKSFLSPSGFLSRCRLTSSSRPRPHAGRCSLRPPPSCARLEVRGRSPFPARHLPHSFYPWAVPTRLRDYPLLSRFPPPRVPVFCAASRRRDSLSRVYGSRLTRRVIHISRQPPSAPPLACDGRALLRVHLPAPESIPRGPLVFALASHLFNGGAVACACAYIHPHIATASSDTLSG